MARTASQPNELARRQCIVIALRAGMKPATIVRSLNLPKSTVYRVAGAYSSKETTEEASCVVDRKTHIRPRPKRTSKLVNSIRNRVLKDHHVSCRRLAMEFKMSDRTLRRVLHEDLLCKSYVPKSRQMLSTANKALRIERCRKLIDSLKHDAAHRIRFFSDEKIFTVDQKFNRQNQRCYTSCSEEACIIPKTKFSASVHVMGVVSSEGHIMPPHFFKKGETVTKEVYLRVLQTVVKPWMDLVSDGKPYVFQQDGAPAHTSSIVQAWLSSNVSMFWPKDFWPPNSPDLNPLDYYVWGAVEARSNKHRHPSIDSSPSRLGGHFEFSRSTH